MTLITSRASCDAKNIRFGRGWLPLSQGLISTAYLRDLSKEAYFGGLLKGLITGVFSQGWGLLQGKGLLEGLISRAYLRGLSQGLITGLGHITKM